MTDAGISTSVVGLAAHDFACPVHGQISGVESSACAQCGRRPYDLEDEDDAAILLSLRKVAKQRRMSWATAVGSLLCVGASVAIDLGLQRFPTVSAMRILLVIAATPVAAIPIERLFRRFQPKALQAVDRKLLGKGRG